MEYVTLNNGVKMPQLGYGVYPVIKMARSGCGTHCNNAPDTDNPSADIQSGCRQRGFAHSG